MKTKLFSLFIAIFLFGFGSKAQNTAKTTADTYPVITLIGSGNGGWTDTAETPLLTADGISYSLVDKILTDGEVKFREGKCWTGGCPATVTNVYGWGPTDAQFAVDGGWPSGTNAAPVDGGKNIQSKAGSWTITFNRLAGTWSFVAGKPIPVVKLVGSAVTTPGGVVLNTADGVTFKTASKVSLVPGTCQFSLDGVLAGGLTFPTGDAEEGPKAMTVTTTGIDYDITFDYSLYKYSFAVATFPTIAIVGSAAGGWPTGASGEVDKNQMSTTDGITYTINNLPIVGGPDQKCLFRGGNAWNIKYGEKLGFPTGTNAGGQDIEVFDATATGTYNVTLNTSTGAFTFTKITYALVGSAAGGWPTGASGEVDDQVLTTTDGVNYTLSNISITGGPDQKCLFRANNAWNIKYGQKLGFPTGTNDGGQDIEVFNTASTGMYNVALNVLTGVFSFTPALGVNKFDANSFKAYPNPTRSSWNITSNDDITSVQVFDVLGKSVYARFGASKEVTVNASELSKGVYFAKVSSANGTSTLKLVKE